MQQWDYVTPFLNIVFPFLQNQEIIHVNPNCRLILIAADIKNSRQDGRGEQEEDIIIKH